MPDISLLMLLFVALAFLCAIALVASRMDFLQPAVIGSAVMTISAFFAVLGAHWWNCQMSFEGWWIIVAAMMVFVAAGLWTAHMSRPCKAASGCSGEIYEISLGWMCFFCLLMLVMAYFSAQAMYDLSLALGNTEGYRGMIRVVRKAIEADEGMIFNRWMNYRAIAAQMIATAYLYIFLHDVILGGWRWRFLAALPPVLCYFPFLILSTGRMTMLCFVIYAFVVATVLYLKKYGYAAIACRRAVGYALFAGGAFFLLFYLMGLITGKTSDAVDRSYLQIIAHYAGLSLPAFGEIVTYPVLEDGLIGSHTLGAAYRVLASIGLPLPMVQNFMPFTTFDGIDTNVYTVLWRYTWDFGMVGMLFMLFLISVGYTLAYSWIRHEHLHPYALMVYALFAYPLFWFPMDDRLLMEVFNTTTIYDLVLLFALYELLMRHAKKTSIGCRARSER